MTRFYFSLLLTFFSLCARGQSDSVLIFLGAPHQLDSIQFKSSQGYIICLPYHAGFKTLNAYQERDTAQQILTLRVDGIHTSMDFSSAYAKPFTIKLTPGKGAHVKMHDSVFSLPWLKTTIGSTLHVRGGATLIFGYRNDDQTFGSVIGSYRIPYNNYSLAARLTEGSTSRDLLVSLPNLGDRKDLQGNFRIKGGQLYPDSIGSSLSQTPKLVFKYHSKWSLKSIHLGSSRLYFKNAKLQRIRTRKEPLRIIKNYK